MNIQKNINGNKDIPIWNDNCIASFIFTFNYLKIKKIKNKDTHSLFI